jgi:hypothetical protein
MPISRAKCRINARGFRDAANPHRTTFHRE